MTKDASFRSFAEMGAALAPTVDTVATVAPTESPRAAAARKGWEKRRNNKAITTGETIPPSGVCAIGIALADTADATAADAEPVTVATSDAPADESVSTLTPDELDEDSRALAIEEMVREDTVSTTFQDAFGDVGALSILNPGDGPQELDMPEPAAAQYDCAAIISTIFDLFRDTRLEDSAQPIAWGIVNSFHYEAQKLAREEDTLARELGEMVRIYDPSEVHATETEELQIRTQTKAEQRAALECMRDYAAACYRNQTGRPWSAARGSQVSSATTASQIAGADFLKARAKSHNERHNPTGPLVVFSGGSEWHDWQQLWDRLDAIKARIPNMTLCTTAQRKGADAIAASWASSRKIALVAFAPETSRYGNRAGFKRNEKLLALRPVEAIVCQGSGLQSNLLDALKKARVPTHAFAIAGQAPAPTGDKRTAAR